MCCRVYDIDELRKPAGLACVFAHAQSCAIHGLHPKTCKTFRCFWLDKPELGPEWKPSLAGFVLRLEEDGVMLWVEPEPERPLSWRVEPYYSQIKQWSWAIKTKLGLVAVQQPEGVYVVFPEIEVLIPDPPKGARFEAGYRAGIGGAVPWARLVREEAPELVA
jgi:hypothetical protein